MYAILPSGMIPTSVITDDMFTVRCTSVETTRYDHNLGIVAVIKGQRPEEDVFDIVHPVSKICLGTYTVVPTPDQGRYRLWVQTADAEPQARKAAPKTEDVIPAAAPAPQVLPVLLATSTTPNYSGKIVTL